MIRLLFCGDVVPGGVLPYQEQYVDEAVLAYLKQADLRIGTLEAAVGSNLAFDATKMRDRKNIIYVRDEDFFRVKELGFDVVSLANNHVFDLGEVGLRNTLKRLAENNIAYCGAGMDLQSSQEPAVVECNGKSIAILAYCMYGNKYLGHVELAGEEKPGVCPLDMDLIADGIKKARKLYDYVIVMPHWGIEYSYLPMEECIPMAKKMIDLGADAVIGGHPHQIQPIVRYKSRYICFSMGNFLFPDYYMAPPRPIWYPTEDTDLTSIKETKTYLKHIDEPVKLVWNDVSRVGYVLCLVLEGEKIRLEKKYVKLSADNVVRFYLPERDMKIKLAIGKLMVENSMLRHLYAWYRQKGK